MDGGSIRCLVLRQDHPHGFLVFERRSYSYLGFPCNSSRPFAALSRFRNCASANGAPLREDAPMSVESEMPRRMLNAAIAFYRTAFIADHAYPIVPGRYTGVGAPV